MSDRAREAGEALAEAIIRALGPRPPGAGKADRRTQQAHARRQALDAARAGGCICAPDITYHAVDPRGWEVPSLTVAHDDWCPLAEHDSQLIAFNQATPHPRPSRNEPCPCGSGRKYKHCHCTPTRGTP